MVSHLPSLDLLDGYRSLFTLPHFELVIWLWMSIMSNMEMELLTHIERIVWDVNVPNEEKIGSIQNLMYQWGANMDRRSIDMFGDDDD